MVVTEETAAEKRPADAASEKPGETAGDRKRQKSDASTSQKPPAGDGILLTELPMDLLARCLTALGPGHYRFVAGSCKALREAHRQAFGDPQNRFITRGSSIANINHASGLLLKIWEDETTPEHKGEHVEFESVYGAITKTLSRVGALGRTAASLGNLPVLEHLIEKYQKSCAYEKKICSRYIGHLLDQGGTEGYTLPTTWTESAAGAGQLEVCKWIHDYIEKTMASESTERTSRWYRSPNRNESPFICCVYAACKNKKWPVLRWALQDVEKAFDCTGGSKALGHALVPLGETADMDILRWCIHQKVPEDSPVWWARGRHLPLHHLAGAAAGAGRVDFLAVLHAHGIT